MGLRFSILYVLSAPCIVFVVFKALDAKLGVCFPKCVCVGGGGGTLIFSYIRRLGPFFWVQNFEFRYFFGFSEKLIFFVYENFVDIFLGSSQNWTILRGHFYAF